MTIAAATSALHRAPCHWVYIDFGKAWFVHNTGSPHLHDSRMFSAIFTVSGTLLRDTFVVFAIAFAALLAVFLVMLAAYYVVRMYVGQRSGYGARVEEECFDEGRVVDRSVVWLVAWFTNLYALAGSAWQTAAGLFATLVSNWTTVAGFAIVFSAALLLDTYLPGLLTALNAGWTCYFAPIARPLVLPLWNLIAIGLDAITPVTNFVFVACPGRCSSFPLRTSDMRHGRGHSVPRPHGRRRHWLRRPALAGWIRGPTLDIGPDLYDGFADNVALAVADMQNFRQLHVRQRRHRVCAAVLSVAARSRPAYGPEPVLCRAICGHYAGRIRPWVLATEAFVAQGGTVNSAVI